jgi:chemotaxis protein methyltransferase CheR
MSSIARNDLNIERSALESLAGVLLEKAGLKITPDGYYGLRLALQARLPALKLTDAGQYVLQLRRDGESELRELLPLVTVGKTEFFRDSRQFNSFENDVLPKLLQRVALEKRQARIWSAGCATGEEPYSIAMAALERGATPADILITATDINPVAIESARKGVFAGRRLIGLSELRIARFLQPATDGYEVKSHVKKLIQFSSNNLAAPIWHDILSQSLDVIFCRNVIIYFDQPTIAGVLERFYECLRPGGWLFLGYSESMFKFSTRFEMVEVAGTFVYQRPLAGAARTNPAQGEKAPRRSSTDVETALRELRIARPLPAIPSTPSQIIAMPIMNKKTPVERLAEVVDSVQNGAFPKALRLARLLCDDEPQDLAALLTLGNVYSLMGSVEEARSVFELALSRESFCVEARLYLALAEMQGNMLEQAKTELTRALFLEPNLALGHYLLAQVSERLGEPEPARRSYRNAIAQRKMAHREFIGHFPELPSSNEAIAQAAQFRLTALAERSIP